MLDRMKGMMGMGPKVEDFDLSKPFTLDDYAAQLNKAKTIGNVASYLPKSVTSQLPPGTAEKAAAIYAQQVKIVECMTPEDKAQPTKLTRDAKVRIAGAAGVTPAEVEDVVVKFEYMRGATVRMVELKKQGKKLPSTWAEMEQLMAGGGGAGGGAPAQTAAPGSQIGPTKGMTVVKQNTGVVGKTAKCPCGSGKRYKRCCWTGD